MLQQFLHFLFQSMMTIQCPHSRCNLQNLEIRNPVKMNSINLIVSVLTYIRQRDEIDGSLSALSEVPEIYSKLYIKCSP